MRRIAAIGTSTGTPFLTPRRAVAANPAFIPPRLAGDKPAPPCINSGPVSAGPGFFRGR